jgi:hypothetical protein
MTTSSARERQRVKHLVLGEPRPRPPKRRRSRAPIALEPGVEEWVALRERWSHKSAGTAETHEHADQARRRPGSLARLFERGAIDKDQLAAAEQIAVAHRAITADVAIRTASLETRVDGGLRGPELELLGLVWAELTYTCWRAAVSGPIDALLAVIVHDVGLTIVARRHGMSMPRARRMLTDSLDLWWKFVPRGRREAIASVAAQT